MKRIKITVLALITSLTTSLLNIVNAKASDDYQNAFAAPSSTVLSLLGLTN